MNLMLAFVALMAAASVGLLAYALRGLLRSVEVDDRNYQDPLPLVLRLLWPLLERRSGFARGHTPPRGA